MCVSYSIPHSLHTRLMYMYMYVYAPQPLCDPVYVQYLYCWSWSTSAACPACGSGTEAAPPCGDGTQSGRQLPWWVGWSAYRNSNTHTITAANHINKYTTRSQHDCKSSAQQYTYMYICMYKLYTFIQGT